MQTHPEPRTHADEIRDIAEIIARHGAWSDHGLRALHNLRELADDIAEWRASTGPAVHHGALPDGVVDLTWWKKQRRVRT